MCGRYALYGPIFRHRKNKPVDDLPDWYPSLVDTINARPMRFNVAPTDVMSIVGVNREGGISTPRGRDLQTGPSYCGLSAQSYARSLQPLWRG